MIDSVDGLRRLTWLLALACCSSAGNADAASILSLSGSGQLRIETSGTAYFDTSSLDLVDLDLTAGDRLEVGPAFPAGTPGAAFTPFGPIVTAGSADLVFAGDLFFDALDFSGSLEVVANGIFVRGDIAVTGDIRLYAGAELVIAASLSTTGSASSCGGGVILLAAGPGDPLSPCGGGTGGVEIGPITGAEAIDLGGLIVITPGVVPEPGAMSLFVCGVATLALRRTRRVVQPEEKRWERR